MDETRPAAAGMGNPMKSEVFLEPGNSAMQLKRARRKAPQIR